MDASVLGCLGQNMELVGNPVALLRWEGHKPTANSPKSAGSWHSLDSWLHGMSWMGMGSSIPQIHSFVGCQGMP